jgi:hypothetical protein
MAEQTSYKQLLEAFDAEDGVRLEAWRLAASLKSMVDTAVVVRTNNPNNGWNGSAFVGHAMNVDVDAFASDCQKHWRNAWQFMGLKADVLGQCAEMACSISARYADNKKVDFSSEDERRQLKQFLIGDMWFKRLIGPLRQSLGYSGVPMHNKMRRPPVPLTQGAAPAHFNAQPLAKTP